MIRSLDGVSPRIHPAAFVSEFAYVIGDVEVGEGSSIWPGAVVRADTGKITIEDKVHLESYRMTVEGKGKAGSLRSQVSFKFSQEDGGTRIELSGDAKVSGVVARVGQRLMGAASKMLMNQFFGCLKSRLERVSSPVGE